MRGQTLSWAPAPERPRHVTKIRAYALWSLVEALRMKFGARGLHGVRMGLSRERRAQFRTLPAQSAWSEHGLYVDLLRSAVDALYGGAPVGAFELARAARQIDAKRMFAALGIFDSPRVFLSQLRSIRSHYFDGGAVEGTVVTEGLLRFELTGLVTPCAVVANDVAGGVAGMLESSGARDIHLIGAETTVRSCTAWIAFKA